MACTPHNIFNNIMQLADKAFLPYKVKLGLITYTNKVLF